MGEGKVKRFGERAQAFIMRDPGEEKKFTLLVGSVRSSKTWSVTAKIIVHLCRYKVEGRRVICGKNKGSVYRNILSDLFEIVGKENYSYNSQTGELWLFGTQWFVMGANDESAYTNILGMTIGIFVADEVVEFPRSFFFQIPLRMSPDGSRFYGTTNPHNPHHYLKAEVIDNPKWKPMLEVLTFTMDDNPNISEGRKNEIKASQVGVYYLRFILGQWIAAQGSIYKDCWSEALLYDEDSRPPTLYGWGGFVDHLLICDYGTVNPLAMYECVDDGTTLWIDREFWWDSNIEMKQLTDSQYGEKILRWMSPEGLILSDGTTSLSRVARRATPRIILDPSAASFRAELQNRCFWVVDANNDVLDGIRKTSTVMASRRIRVHKDCVNLIREIPAYMWNNDKAKKTGEEEPIKLNDHGCDALRYGVEEVFSEFRLLTAA